MKNNTGLRPPARLLKPFATLVALACSLVVQAADPATYTLDIPAQDLGTALRKFASTTHQQIIFDSRRIAGLKSTTVVGSYSVTEGLRVLLGNAGVSVRTTPAGVLYVDPEPHGPLDTGRSADHAPEPNRPIEESNVEASDPASTALELQEVVVTAQKRVERLQDVPVPVTALSGTSLLEGNQLRLQDYYTSVPGLSVAPVGTQSTQILSIRGINTGIAGNPSVGITIDDVPYGSSTNLGGGPLIPDIDPFDLASIEVLRGPQGTLYGASSLGGLIKFVTVDPSTTAVSGRVEADGSAVSHGDSAGYAVRGAVNIPLGDTFALHVSGFRRKDAGYIDNPVRGESNLNPLEAHGGRLATLWRPNEKLSLRVSAFFQQQKTDGSFDVDPTLGDLKQNYLPGIGGYNRKFQAYSVTLNAKLGAADLTSVSGYNINSYHDSWDASSFFGECCASAFGVTGAPSFDSNETRKFTQEIRLSLPLGPQLDWLFGLFYTHESSTYVDSFGAADSNTGALVATMLNNSFPTTFREYAAFTDLTYHVSDRFNIQIGGRESEIHQTFSQTQTGPLAAPDIPQLQAKSNAFTYLVTPQLKVSSDLMAYLRLASGYRAGGANALIGGAATGLPLQYEPDQTHSYELGVKGSVSHRSLSFDASLFYIDWKDIQLSLFDANSQQAYLSNAGRAKSQGIELSVESRPVAGLTIGAWLTWNDAVLKEGFPAASIAAGGTYGVAGDRLPYGSRFSGNLSIEQQFPVTGTLTGLVGATVSYVGNRVGEFTGSPERQGYPSYARADMRGGLKWDGWSTNLIITNLTDRRGVLAGGLGSFPPNAFTIIQPRTVGLSVSRAF